MLPGFKIFILLLSVCACVCAHLTAGDRRDQIHQIPVEVLLQEDLGAGSQTWVRSVSVSFTCECVIIPASFVEKASLPPLNCVYSFIKGEFTIFVWVHPRLCIRYH